MIKLRALLFTLLFNIYIIEHSKTQVCGYQVANDMRA